MREWCALVLLVVACGGSDGHAREAIALDADVVVVPAGWFTMGSVTGRPNEAPAHDVWVDAFSIDRFEVTVGQYARFVAATGWRSPGNWDGIDASAAATTPITHVAWPDAAAYCAWVGKRLPTEAEWEKAARGIDSRRYPWGDTWATGNAAAGLATGPVPVGSYAGGASPFGAHDMVGNVHEWVADYYDPGYYATSPQRNPRGPDNDRNRVIRGGSWASPPEWATTTFRDSSHSDVGDARFGFRCAADQR